MHYMSLFNEIKTVLESNPDMFDQSKLTRSFYDKLKLKCKSKNKEFFLGVDLWFVCKKRDLKHIAKSVEVVRIILQTPDEEVKSRNFFALGAKYVLFNQKLFCHKKYYFEL